VAKNKKTKQGKHGMAHLFMQGKLQNNAQKFIKLTTSPLQRKPISFVEEEDGCLL
jgi:hypothetical protein